MIRIKKQEISKNIQKKAKILYMTDIGPDQGLKYEYKYNNITSIVTLKSYNDEKDEVSVETKQGELKIFKPVAVFIIEEE